MFLPLPLGGATGVVVVSWLVTIIPDLAHSNDEQYILYWVPKYNKEVDKYHPHPVPPEVRLQVACAGAPAFAVAFFWFG